MDIARQDSASFGESGVYTNYNTALGKHGINGLKTGNNNQNPGALLFTADVQTGSHTLELSGSVMAAESLAGAIRASEALVESAGQNFEAISYARAGQIVGEARTAWGVSTPIRTKGALELVRWKAEKVTEQHTLHAASATVAGSIGALVVHAGEVQSSTTLKITTPADKPSVWWRLTRLK
jgi:D-alanyl-D-alanine carboxypeptidase (penicillin-binding protein 5/6)